MTTTSAESPTAALLDGSPIAYRLSVFWGLGGGQAFEHFCADHEPHSVGRSGRAVHREGGTGG